MTMSVKEAYEQILMEGPRRKKKGTPTIEDIEISPIRLAYVDRQLDQMRDHLEGFNRVNKGASVEHVSHVFLRQYGKKVYPWLSPFLPSDRVPQEVWDRVVQVVRNIREGKYNGS